ncbi:MAG TPA: glycosyltransferase [Chitinophagaceae bacterium]|nr:glycosyltransferase [Chitinophagaceae bacterium]
MQQKRPVTVLVAPLDWGLGHATRCIPIIHELIRQGVRVKIAAGSGQKNMLEMEFPQLEFLDIPEFKIRYKKGIFLKWGLIFRIPALLRQIKRENKWLEEIVRLSAIDAVISDSRYGLFHKGLFCVFITHQLNIQSGWVPFSSPRGRSRFAGAVGGQINRIILKWNYKYISKFSSCWVPDLEGSLSVAGILSHPPVVPPFPVKYIGILSRFERPDKKDSKNMLLILISGPEPQRSYFENILFSQLPGIKMETVVVRGLPGSGVPVPFIQEGIKIYNHLSTDQLNSLINESAFIIARSGYSTIMDLVHLKKNAILVPTPGQTEQEYLGFYMQEKKWMYCLSQKNFNLGKALKVFQQFELGSPELPGSLLKEVIEDFIAKISLQN